MTGAFDDQAEKKAKGRCPVCRRPTVARLAPFCSRRCADADLARWLDGAYVVGGDEPSDEGDTGEE